MRAPTVRPIAIAAGGTGGHFFPAEALAAALIARGQRVVLLTDARSGGLKSPVFANRETHVLPGAGIAGRGLVRGAKAVLALAAGVMKARSLLARLNAGAIVGFGGYPCVPPVLATRFLRRPPAVILHEQNAVLGRANRFLSGRIDRLALSFAGTTRVPANVRTEVTGNPVRPAITALADAAYTPPDGPIRLLVLGGSLGARVFSDVVPAALLALPADLRARLSVTQQCRAEDLDRVRTAYEQAGIAADLAPFFGDVAERLSAAHLVIARAGASTVAELAVAGRPAILVPLPGAIDDHQTGNARALADAGGAWVMPQNNLPLPSREGGGGRGQAAQSMGYAGATPSPQPPPARGGGEFVFTPANLTARLTELLRDPDALTRAAAAARTQARTDAAERLADLVEALMHQETHA